LAAVASFGTRLDLYQDFTADVAALERAVDRAARAAAPPGDFPSRRAPDPELPSLADRLPRGRELVAATPGIEAALAALGDALAGVPGRKNLVLFSGGFGELSETGGYEVADRRFRPMVEALNAANVAVYAVSLAPPRSGDPLASSLSRLSDETGGRPFFDLLQFREPLERVAETTNGYYLVAFRAPRGAPDEAFRRIEVELVNPEFRVTARRGYRPRPPG
jgi:VWFA-related protein